MKSLYLLFLLSIFQTPVFAVSDLAWEKEKSEHSILRKEKNHFQKKKRKRGFKKSKRLKNDRGASWRVLGFGLGAYLGFYIGMVIPIFFLFAIIMAFYSFIFGLAQVFQGNFDWKVWLGLALSSFFLLVLGLILYFLLIFL